MATIEKSITVNVPVRTGYNQWTQFEAFPQFMEGGKSIRQLDDKNLVWRAQVGPKEEEWNAEIMEQIPDQRIAWRSTSGARNAGVVTFHRLDENATRVMLQVEYDPEGVVENVGDKLGAVSRRVEGDLERFKQFIEQRGQPTGAWRGEIHGDRVHIGADQGPGASGQATGSPGVSSQSSPSPDTGRQEMGNQPAQAPSTGRAAKKTKGTGSRSKKTKS
jgi:hypothetical protein